MAQPNKLIPVNQWFPNLVGATRADWPAEVLMQWSHRFNMPESALESRAQWQQLATTARGTVSSLGIRPSKQLLPGVEGHILRWFGFTANVLPSAGDRIWLQTHLSIRLHALQYALTPQLLMQWCSVLHQAVWLIEGSRVKPRIFIDNAEIKSDRELLWVMTPLFTGFQLNIPWDEPTFLTKFMSLQIGEPYPSKPTGPLYMHLIARVWHYLRGLGKAPYPPEPAGVDSPDKARHALDVAIGWCADQAVTTVTASPSPLLLPAIGTVQNCEMSRLQFDSQTYVITLDGTPWKIGNPKAFLLCKTIAENGQPITRAQIRGHLRGFRGDKTIPNLLKLLPRAVRAILKSGHAGYWVELPKQKVRT